MDAFEQKRRNRPIDINDIAISKVGIIKLDGFTSEQEDFIRSRHQDVLIAAHTLNLDCKRNDMECGILVDLYTWEYLLIEGRGRERNEPSKVFIDGTIKSKEMLNKARKNQLMFIHNHPSTGTFSAQDIKTFCNKKELYIISAVGNNGTIYMLVKEAGFDGIEVLSAYGKLAEKYISYENNATLAVKDILKHANKYKLKYIRK